VTELTQPLAAVAAGAEHEAAAHASLEQTASFGELVEAHFDWCRARQGGAAAHARRIYEDVLARFERRHGRIVGAYWCTHVQSAVALTEQTRLRGLLGSTYTFHRETDWATRGGASHVASELHRCDELAVRAGTVLTGVRRRICMHLVLASAAHLLTLVDVPADHVDGDAATTKTGVDSERAELAKADAYYREAANGQAQMVYFGGMAAVAVTLSIVAAVWLTLDWSSPVAALIAGAVGAVVSVIQRINTGKFTLEYDVGGPYAFFLGGLRPLIGGAFALAISFAFSGGLLHLPVAAGETTDTRRLALLVLAFVAGFSERWAQDTLTAIVPNAHRTPDPAGAGQGAAPGEEAHLHP
jgi:hypothetical protein